MKDYIVKLKAPHSKRRGRVKAELETIDAYITSMTADQALAAWNAAEIEYIEPDQPVSVAAVQSPALSWGLDRIDQPALPLDNAYNYTATGAGVEAFIIDSGIRYTHTEFQGRAKFGADFVGDGFNDGLDRFGHGSHVAGIVGGKNYGVAKNVTLYSMRVLDATGNGMVSAMVQALNWITQRKQSGKYKKIPMCANISIILSGPSQTLDTAVNTCADAGVVIAVAAGNWGYDAGNYSPARAEKVLCVGATNSLDQRPGYSNVGDTVDIYAPAQTIPSVGILSDGEIVYKSGTSMASPFVCGVAAQWLEMNPKMPSADVRAGIVANAAIVSLETATGYVTVPLLQAR